MIFWIKSMWKSYLRFMNYEIIGLSYRDGNKLTKLCLANTFFVWSVSRYILLTVFDGSQFKQSKNNFPNDSNLNRTFYYSSKSGSLVRYYSINYFIKYQALNRAKRSET